MLRIAYLLHWNEGQESGVFKKVVSQVNEWTHQGHEVGIFLFSKNESTDWVAALPHVKLTIQTYRKGVTRYADFRSLISKVEQWSPDVIYHRYDLFYFGLPALLRKVPSVLEINSNDVTEMRIGNKAKYMYHLLTRGYVLGAASGFVFVNPEIHEADNFRELVTDKTVIGNSIALDEYSVVSPANNKHPHLIFIGSPGLPWHGIEAIADMAELESSWHFDIIGVSASELERPVPSNMTFHGRLTRPQYEPLMQQADVAIGTLALYRKGADGASSLKIREYLAYGLPVINGYPDHDFSEDVPYILQIPNEPNNTVKSAEDIRRFVQAWHGRRVERSQIEHLDTKVKEGQRLQYMEQIMRKEA